MKRERYPFTASVEGLQRQIQLIDKLRYPSVWHVEETFHPVRKWRFDVCCPTLKIACEYHGGLFMARRGGHQSVKGARNDWEKLNEAQLLGWIVLQFGPDEIRTGDAMHVIERAIKLRCEGGLPTVGPAKRRDVANQEVGRE